MIECQLVYAFVHPVRHGFDNPVASHPNFVASPHAAQGPGKQTPFHSVDTFLAACLVRVLLEKSMLKSHGPSIQILTKRRYQMAVDQN